MAATILGVEDSVSTATLSPSVPQAPTFSLGTIRSVLAEMQAEYPDRAWRLIKAASIVAVRDISPYAGIGWLVGSECDADKSYWVQPIDGQMTCDCEDAKRRGYPCKHALAVLLLQRCERAQAEAEPPLCTSCHDTPAVVRGLCARCNRLILRVERERDDAAAHDPTCAPIAYELAPAAVALLDNPLPAA